MNVPITYQVSIKIYYKDIEKLMEILDENQYDYSAHEIIPEQNSVESHENDEWQIDIIVKSPQELLAVKLLIEQKIINFTTDKMLTSSIVPDVDWVMEVQKSMKPILVDNQIYIYPPHMKNTEIPGLINIEINPSRAFGTGEHQTTRACLKALLQIKESATVINKVTEIGTGSGVLAIAAAKIFPGVKIIATDIDEIAVDIAKNNCQLNQQPDINLFAADGFNDERHTKQNDLIIANILAEPLKLMSTDIYCALNSGGLLVISGFLQYQKNDLLDVFKKIGFIVIDSIEIENWVATILQKQ